MRAKLVAAVLAVMAGQASAIALRYADTMADEEQPQQQPQQLQAARKVFVPKQLHGNMNGCTKYKARNGKVMYRCGKKQVLHPAKNQTVRRNPLRCRTWKRGNTTYRKCAKSVQYLEKWRENPKKKFRVRRKGYKN